MEEEKKKKKKKKKKNKTTEGVGETNPIDQSNVDEQNQCSQVSETSNVQNVAAETPILEQDRQRANDTEGDLSGNQWENLDIERSVPFSSISHSRRQFVAAKKSEVAFLLHSLRLKVGASSMCSNSAVVTCKTSREVPGRGALKGLQCLSFDGLCKCIPGFAAP